MGALYPIYMRGEAYLAANRGTEAAAEFQTILSHAGINFYDPVLGAAAPSYSRERTFWLMSLPARRAYQDMLTFWKDADPDIPILKHARAEFAKL
jgi:hypothetical protein